MAKAKTSVGAGVPDNLIERMNDEAVDAFNSWSAGKTDAAIEKAAARCAKLGLRNRNGRIFRETVEEACDEN